MIFYIYSNQFSIYIEYMWVKETRQATKERRRKQIPKTYQVKILRKKLSKEQKQFLEWIFRETKWLYNYTIWHISGRLKTIHKLPVVPVKIPTDKKWEYKEELRELKYVRSQMKQGIADKIQFSLQALWRLKKQWYKVWRLKFKSDLQTIYLKQFRNVYDINKEKEIIRLQGYKKWFRVRWLKQIPDWVEIASAELRRVGNDFFIYINTYIDKEKEDIIKSKTAKQVWEIKEHIWIDFWIGVALALSNWLWIDFNIWETEKVKRLQRKFNRNYWKDGRVNKIKKKIEKKYWQIKEWEFRRKNRWKLRRKIQSEWRKIKNRRLDIMHRILAIFKLFDFIYMQDENFKAWHKKKKWNKWFSRKIQNTGMWRIKSVLIQNLSEKVKVIDRFEATTQICSNCWYRKEWDEKMEIKDRVYECPKCWYVEDRDKNSARNMIRLGWWDLNKASNTIRNYWKVIIKQILKPNKYINIITL